MKTVAIVQARMGSTRLPGKVLLPLAGKPVLGHVVERLSACSTLDGIVVATTTDPGDDPVAEFCTAAGVGLFRGNAEDVLDRYRNAAIAFDADSVVRITADCPAIDPEVVDQVVAGFMAGDWDLFGLSGEFPDGLDCTVFDRRALEQAWREASLASEREHVGPYLEKHPELFAVGGLEVFHGERHHRWTLDEPEDYELLTVVFDALYRPDRYFTSSEVIEFLDRNPGVMAINENVVRNEGYQKSLENDEVIT